MPHLLYTQVGGAMGPAEPGSLEPGKVHRPRASPGIPSYKAHPKFAPSITSAPAPVHAFLTVLLGRSPNPSTRRLLPPALSCHCPK